MTLSSNVVADSNDKNHFPHKLLSRKLQVSRLCQAFANNLLGNIKLLKSQLHKKGESGGFLGRMLGPLLKTGFHLKIINVIKVLAKRVLIQLGQTEAASEQMQIFKKNIFDQV